MKISIETNTDDKAAAPALDRLLTRIVAILEKDTGLKFNVKADGRTVRLAHKARLLRKGNVGAESVTYDATEIGYTVFVLDYAGKVVNEYKGGGPTPDANEHPLNEGGFSYESNLQAAMIVARDIAEALGVDPRYVQHNADILEAERALPRFFYPDKT